MIPFAIAAVLAVPATARAQRQVPLGQGGATTVDASVQAYGGYDQADTRTITGLTDSPRDGHGNSIGGSGSLSLSRAVGRATFDVNGSADLRYYTTVGSLSGVPAQTSRADMSFRIPLARRVSMTIGQSLDTSSFYQYDPFSGLVTTAANDITLATADYRLARGRTSTYGFTDGLSIQVGRYTSITMGYRLRYVAFPGEQVDYLSQGGGGGLERRISRHATLHLGYDYDHGGSVSGHGTGYHTIDSGVSYDAPLSFSRRTYFSVSTGAAVIAMHDPATGTEQQAPKLTISTGLRHQLGRTWQTGVEYRREPQHVEFYSNSIYANVIAGSLRGRTSRRTSLLIAGGYSATMLDVGTRSSNNQTVFGSARTTITIGRRVGLYAEYGYFGFDGTGTVLANTVTNRVARHAIRGGLSWSKPLIAPRQVP